MVFTHSSGKTLSVDGFWDGGNVWKVRFALPETGQWTWAASSSDPGLTGSGTVNVAAPSSAQIANNRNYRGHVKVSLSGRYFTHADGTPFLYVGDTLWAVNSLNAGANANQTGAFYTWADDRKSKDFSVAQVATFIGFSNEGGAAFPNDDWSNLNPAFFNASDRRFSYLWQQGFVVAMHPTWITESSMGLPEAINISRYIMARYGAYNLVWSLSGEYNIPEATPTWSNDSYANVRALGMAVNGPDGFNAYGHPTSVHPGGATSGPATFGSNFLMHNETWLDHNWLQTHTSVEYVPAATSVAYGAVPTKPVIEAEPCYEDPGHSPQTCDTPLARAQAWAALLSGAAGHVYGAAGVYFMDNPGALGFAGSTHLKFVSDFFGALNWWELDPTIGCVTIGGAAPDLQNPSHPRCAAKRGSTYVVYIPAGNSQQTIALTNLDAGTYLARWYNPQTGQYTWISQRPVGATSWSVPAHDDNDWVVVLTSAWSIPGTIQAEDFDEGAAGTAYADAEQENLGGAYRGASSGVDIQQNRDDPGYDVGWTRAGEWMKYTVNVAFPGTYTAEIRVASDGPGGDFHIEFDGVNVTGTITVPSTGGWQNWTTLSTTVTLGAGSHVMRISMDRASSSTMSIANIDFVRFTAAGGFPRSTPYTGAPISVPGTVEAEQFDAGGEGVAYHDVDSANQGGALRTSEGVDIQPNQNPSGGYDIGWTRTGEWLNYSINVATAGTYLLQARVASAGPGGKFRIEFDGHNKTGSIQVPDSGDWQTWKTLPAIAVKLNAGPQTMRIVMEEASPSTESIGNFDSITLTAAPATPGLIAQWKMDEGSGTTAADASGNGHTGALMEGAGWDAGGRFGAAVRFDGIDDYIKVNPALIGNAGAFTLSAWVKIASAQKGVVYGEINTAGGNPFLYISINENVIGDAEFGIRDDNGNWVGLSTAALNLNNGLWHHLAAVQRSKTDRELFVDGVSRGTDSAALGTVTLDQAEMGRFKPSSTLNQLLGSVDEVRVYNRALSAAEIQNLLNGD